MIKDGFIFEIIYVCSKGLLLIEMRLVHSFLNYASIILDSLVSFYLSW